MTTKQVQVRGGKYQPWHAPAVKAACRAMYEGEPGATCQSVADATGVPEGTIKRWKWEEKWTPKPRTLPDLSGRAGELANTFKIRMSELGKPLDDKVAAAEVEKELSTEHAINVRAAVIDRHRKEWSAPRALAYDAIKKAKSGDVEAGYALGKLAKISAETLQIIQVGESRAFGLDQKAKSDDNTVVVIEREATPVADAVDALPAPDDGLDDDLGGIMQQDGNG